MTERRNRTSGRRMPYTNILLNSWIVQTQDMCPSSQKKDEPDEMLKAEVDTVRRESDLKTFLERIADKNILTTTYNFLNPESKI